MRGKKDVVHSCRVLLDIFGMMVH